MNIKRFIASALVILSVGSVMTVPASADWSTDKGKTYWTVNGKKVTGFEQIDGSWYYFMSKDGSMAKGWLKIGTNYYYFSKASGKMLAGNSYNIDGKIYTFGADGKWDGKAAKTAKTTTAAAAAPKASTGFRKGVWNESLAATKKRVGEDWLSMLETEEVSIGVDMTPVWTKYGDKTMISSMDMYIYMEDKLFVGATLYQGTSPQKNGKATESFPSGTMTKAQIDALAKMLTAKAEKTGKEVSEELLAEADTSQFDSIKIYAGTDVIAAVAYTYDGGQAMYIEFSAKALAELSGLSVDDIISQMF
jgi:hypothetical protein